MIVEETGISGTLYRYHPDAESVNYTAQWLVCGNEIKGFMTTRMSLSEGRKFKVEFHRWLDSYDGKLKAFTGVRSIERALKNFDFVEVKSRHN